jgi:hypothetical protein
MESIRQNVPSLVSVISEQLKHIMSVSMPTPAGEQRPHQLGLVSVFVLLN